MDPLLQQLDLWHEGIPTQLLRDAVKRREELTPQLIAALDEVFANPQSFLDDPERNLYYWAAYLLAHFEEPQAFPAIVNLVRLSNSQFKDLVADLVQEDGAMLLANVSDAKIEPITALLHDASAGDDARVAAADALGMLCSWGAVEPIQAQAKFESALRAIQEKNSFVAATIINAATDLNLRDLSPAIKDAFERGVVDRDIADYEFTAEWLHDPDFKPPPPYLHMVQSIEDMVEFFEEKVKLSGLADDPSLLGESGQVFHEGGTYHAPPKPGRNDPCPCRSGKKYKKCCGA